METLPARFPGSFGVRAVALVATAALAGAGWLPHVPVQAQTQVQGGPREPDPDMEEFFRRFGIPIPNRPDAKAAPLAYPSKAVTLYIPAGPGSIVHAMATELQPALRRALGREVPIRIVFDRWGDRAAVEVKGLAADGHSLLLDHVGMSNRAVLERNASREVPLPDEVTLADFESLGMVGEVPVVMIARPNAPFATPAELLRWLQAQKSKVNISFTGNSRKAERDDASMKGRLCALRLRSALKDKGFAEDDLPLLIPYADSNELLDDLTKSMVELSCIDAVKLKSSLTSGTVKAVAAMSEQRWPAIPYLREVPSMTEVGLRYSASAISPTIWYGLYARHGTPAPVLARLRAVVGDLQADPQFARRLQDVGIAAVTDERASPEGQRRFMEAQLNLIKAK